MSEKLVIKNFGPIKSVELELNRFNVLIGENATGKSTVAKVLAVCRYFSYLRPSSGSLDVPIEFGMRAWGLYNYFREGSYVYYKCKHYTFEIDGELKSDFDPETGEPDGVYLNTTTELNPLSEQFKGLLEELKRIEPKRDESSGYGYGSPYHLWQIPSSFYQNDVAKVMDNPFYLPTERGLQSIFSLGKSSIENISDSLFNQLGELYRIAQQFRDEIHIEPLGITYKNDRGRGLIKKDGEAAFTSLYNAASGYQSTIPVVLLVKHYSEFRKKKKTFLIEEPELNLFPTAQHRLMQYLVDMTVNNGHTMLLTTHSPYILTSLNNLMYAFQMGKKDEAATSEIVNKRYWINPEEVSAYLIKTDGTSESIVDREERMIRAEKIDIISREINRQFDLLLKVDLGNDD